MKKAFKALKYSAPLLVLFLAVSIEGITEQYGVGGWVAVCILMLFAYAAATV